MERAFETCKLVEALSKLFRLSLNSGNEIATVANEVEHLKNYIIIQQARYEGMIDFSLDVHQNVMNCKTVKLILQPLVENAIHHGIEKKGEKGTISVTIKEEIGRLICIIEDSGCGVDIEQIRELLKKVDNHNRGFAIKNVNDRIKLYFGDEYGLEFESIMGQGTKVIVYQPLIREDIDYDNSNGC